MFLSSRTTWLGLMVAGLLAFPAAAQYNQFDNSANATLHGDYFVREVLVTNLNPDGSVGTALSAIGTINFDGAGDYTFNGTVMNSTPAAGQPEQQNNRIITGTYGLAPNGFLEIQSLVGTYLDSLNNVIEPDVAYGGVGTAGPNAFVASATETLNYDLLIGIPLNEAATNASFKGTYNAAYLNLLSADVTQIRDATIQQFTADGQGNLGRLQVSGFAANQGSAILSQPVSGATYSLANITIMGGAINFGASSSLLNGSEDFMISPDETLILGGSPGGFDIFVGAPVVSSPSDVVFSRFYFQAALEDDASQLASESLSTIDDFWGSSSATGASEIAINHARLSYGGFFPYDWTYNNSYSVPANGGGVFQPSYEPDQYMLGANGQVVIGSGVGTWYSLMVGLQAPAYAPPTGVSLNPLGIVNAASYAPATNPVAPLEMVILFGSGMASTSFTARTLPLPTQSPDGVQVLINGSPIPLFSTSPTSIVALVPSTVTPDNSVFYATFQVVNNGAPSNAVTLDTNYTAPGVFAVSQGGVGPAAALHADSSLITDANPANNETVELFLAGLGSVNPAVTPDGAGAPTLPPFSMVNSTPSIYLDDRANSTDVNTEVPFAGLAPGYTGLYQVNVAIPAVTTGGDLYLDIDAIDLSGPDGGETAEATVAVAGADAEAVAKEAHPAARRTFRTTNHGIPRVNGVSHVSGRLPHPGTEAPK